MTGPSAVGTNIQTLVSKQEPLLITIICIPAQKVKQTFISELKSSDFRIMYQVHSNEILKLVRTLQTQVKILGTLKADSHTSRDHLGLSLQADSSKEMARTSTCVLSQFKMSFMPRGILALGFSTVYNYKTYLEGFLKI